MRADAGVAHRSVKAGSGSKVTFRKSRPLDSFAARIVVAEGLAGGVREFIVFVAELFPRARTLFLLPGSLVRLLVSSAWVTPCHCSSRAAFIGGHAVALQFHACLASAGGHHAGNSLLVVYAFAGAADLMCRCDRRESSSGRFRADSGALERRARANLFVGQRRIILSGLWYYPVDQFGRATGSAKGHGDAGQRSRQQGQETCQTDVA